MSIFKTMFVLVVVLVMGLSLTLVAGTGYTEEGNVERGKTLFNDPTLGGGTTGKSCNSCHPGGRGLEKAADKEEFKILGETLKSLEDAVNLCIEMALKGKAIDPESQDMADIVAYIKSLKK